MNDDLRYYGNPMNWESTKGDLISREALKKALHSFFDGKVIDEPAYILRDVFYHIDSAPTVEKPQYILKAKNLTAENKKHFQECWNKSAGGLLTILDDYEIVPIERPQGEWIFLKANEEQTDGYECSVCKATYHTRVPYFSEFNFCPNCGAKMKGGAE